MSISAEAGGATAVRVRANKRAKRVFFIMGNDLVSIRLLRVLAGIANGHVNFGGSGRGNRSQSEGEQESEKGFFHHGNDLVSIRLLRVLAGIANGHVNFGGGG